MKTLSKLIAVTAIILLSTVTVQLKAQSISSKIMDASLTVSTGDLSVYLTDTLGINGISIAIGTTADNFNLYSQQFTISGNSFGNGNINDNVLRTTITGLGNLPNYYTRVRILLDNSQYNEIEIHTEN